MPKSCEVLYLYLVVTKETISLVLVREEEGKQLPIYYTNQMLKGSKLNYPILEKVTYAVLIVATKLKPYFEAHTMKVRTNYLLRKILYRSETPR